MSKEVIKSTLMSDICILEPLNSKRPLKCDITYPNIVGINEFGHPNNVLTLVNKANNEMQKHLLESLQPVPDISDGTENMSLRKAFDSCPSRYAQTPLEVAAESQRIADINSPEPTPEPAPEPTPEPVLEPAPAPAAD